MKRLICFPFIIMVAVAMISIPMAQPASAVEKELGQPTPGNTFIDALIYRPVGLVAIPLGAALFVVSLPFSATGGNIGQSFENLVIVPLKFTFARPLGEI